MMSFGEAIRTCLKEKYATFEGRASRSEFWWFILFTVLVGFATGLIDSALGTEKVFIRNGRVQVIGYISTLVWFAFLMPSLAVSFRRLHDRNKTGWLIGGQLILLVFMIIVSAAGSAALSGIFAIAFIVLAIYTFVMYILKGDDGANQYGADPLNPNTNSSIF